MTADPHWHVEEAAAEMQAMPLGRYRNPAPARHQAKLPAIGLFDPLDEMGVWHGRNLHKHALSTLNMVCL
jgi:hypothetical protein